MIFLKSINLNDLKDELETILNEIDDKINNYGIEIDCQHKCLDIIDVKNIIDDTNKYISSNFLNFKKREKRTLFKQLNLIRRNNKNEKISTINTN